MAVVAGVAVGAVTNALIKQRELSEEEAGFAAQVFGGSLPPRDWIMLTNLAGLGSRAFTMPGVDGKIYINLGDAYDNPNPLDYTNPPIYRKRGQLLIHELTHAWQIFHRSFVPGTGCEGIVNQANNTVGESVYELRNARYILSLSLHSRVNSAKGCKEARAQRVSMTFYPIFAPLHCGDATSCVSTCRSVVHRGYVKGIGTSPRW